MGTEVIATDSAIDAVTRVKLAREGSLAGDPSPVYLETLIREIKDWGKEVQEYHRQQQLWKAFNQDLVWAEKARIKLEEMLTVELGCSANIPKSIYSDLVMMCFVLKQCGKDVANSCLRRVLVNYVRRTPSEELCDKFLSWISQR